MQTHHTTQHFTFNTSASVSASASHSLPTHAHLPRPTLAHLFPHLNPFPNLISPPQPSHAAHRTHTHPRPPLASHASPLLAASATSPTHPASTTSTPTPSTTLPLFTLRLIELDHYQSRVHASLDATHSMFSGRALSNVPVVRIWGSTPTGESCCMHVHRYWPYMYVQMPNHVAATRDAEEEHMRRLGAALERAINTVKQHHRKQAEQAAAAAKAIPQQQQQQQQQQRQRQPTVHHDNGDGDEEQQQQVEMHDEDMMASVLTDDELRDAMPNAAAPASATSSHSSSSAFTPRDHLYSVTLHSAIPFYGYHASAARFIKLCFVSPRTTPLAASILLSGALLSTVYQPLESHIPYLLHFLVDAALAGMSWVDCSWVSFRRPIHPRSARDGSECVVNMTVQAAQGDQDKEKQKQRGGNIEWQVDAEAARPSDTGSATGNASSIPFTAVPLSQRVYTESSVPSSLLSASSLPRISSCTLEVDVAFHHITNQQQLPKPASAVNDSQGSGGTSSDAEKQRVVSSLVGLWQEERHRRRQHRRQQRINKRARERAAQHTAAAQHTSTPAASAAADGWSSTQLSSLSLGGTPYTQLTPASSPPRALPPPSALEQSHIAHLRNIALHEKLVTPHSSQPSAASSSSSSPSSLPSPSQLPRHTSPQDHLPASSQPRDYSLTTPAAQASSQDDIQCSQFASPTAAHPELHSESQRHHHRQQQTEHATDTELQQQASAHRDGANVSVDSSDDDDDPELDAADGDEKANEGKQHESEVNPFLRSAMDNARFAAYQLTPLPHPPISLTQHLPPDPHEPSEQPGLSQSSLPSSHVNAVYATIDTERAARDALLDTDEQILFSLTQSYSQHPPSTDQQQPHEHAAAASHHPHHRPELYDDDAGEEHDDTKLAADKQHDDEQDEEEEDGSDQQKLSEGLGDEVPLSTMIDMLHTQSEAHVHEQHSQQSQLQQYIESSQITPEQPDRQQQTSHESGNGKEEADEQREEEQQMDVDDQQQHSDSEGAADHEEQHDVKQHHMCADARDNESVKKQHQHATRQPRIKPELISAPHVTTRLSRDASPTRTPTARSPLVSPPILDITAAAPPSMRPSPALSSSSSSFSAVAAIVKPTVTAQHASARYALPITTHTAFMPKPYSRSQLKHSHHLATRDPRLLSAHRNSPGRAPRASPPRVVKRERRDIVDWSAPALLLPHTQQAHEDEDLDDIEDTATVIAAVDRPVTPRSAPSRPARIRFKPTSKHDDENSDEIEDSEQEDNAESTGVVYHRSSTALAAFTSPRSSSFSTSSSSSPLLLSGSPHGSGRGQQRSPLRSPLESSSRNDARSAAAAVIIDDHPTNDHYRRGAALSSPPIASVALAVPATVSASRRRLKVAHDPRVFINLTLSNDSQAVHDDMQPEQPHAAHLSVARRRLLLDAIPQGTASLTLSQLESKYDSDHSPLPAASPDQPPPLVDAANTLERLSAVAPPPPVSQAAASDQRVHSALSYEPQTISQSSSLSRSTSLSSLASSQRSEFATLHHHFRPSPPAPCPSPPLHTNHRTDDTSGALLPSDDEDGIEIISQLSPTTPPPPPLAPLDPPPSPSDTSPFLQQSPSHLPQATKRPSFSSPHLPLAATLSPEPELLIDLFSPTQASTRTSIPSSQATPLTSPAPPSSLPSALPADDLSSSASTADLPSVQSLLAHHQLMQQAESAMFDQRHTEYTLSSPLQWHTTRMLFPLTRASLHTLCTPPPCTQALLSSLHDFGLPDVMHHPPFYSSYAHYHHHLTFNTAATAFAQYHSAIDGYSSLATTAIQPPPHRIQHLPPFTSPFSSSSTSSSCPSASLLLAPASSAPPPAALQCDAWPRSVPIPPMPDMTDRHLFFAPPREPSAYRHVLQLLPLPPSPQFIEQQMRQLAHSHSLGHHPPARAASVHSVASQPAIAHGSDSEDEEQKEAEEDDQRIVQLASSQLATAAQVIDEQQKQKQKQSEDEDEQMLRPASPKHEEYFFNSISYFLPTPRSSSHARHALSAPASVASAAGIATAPRPPSRAIASSSASPSSAITHSARPAAADHDSDPHDQRAPASPASHTSTVLTFSLPPRSPRSGKRARDDDDDDDDKLDLPEAHALNEHQPTSPRAPLSPPLARSLLFSPTHLAAPSLSSTHTDPSRSLALTRTHQSTAANPSAQPHQLPQLNGLRSALKKHKSRHAQPQPHEHQQLPQQQPPHQRMLRSTEPLLPYPALGMCAPSLPASPSQIDAATPSNSTPSLPTFHSIANTHTNALDQHLTLLSLEMHAASRHDLRPDPRLDPVCAITFVVRYDVHGQPHKARDFTGALICASLPVHGNGRDNGLAPSHSNVSASASSSYPSLPLLDACVQWFTSEHTLLHALIVLVRQVDPDVLLCYETQLCSLGYLVERARVVLDLDLTAELGRVLASHRQREAPREPDEGIGNSAAARYASNHTSNLHITGRILLNLWRILRDELKLTSYTVENVAAHVLGQRYPRFEPSTLTRWFNSTLIQHAAAAAADGCSVNGQCVLGGGDLTRCVDYYLTRCRLNLHLVDELDLIGRTSELARVFGIKFFNVLDRGSQFRVESMLMRVCKAENYVLHSMSAEQRGLQPAMQAIPLIMEPMSQFYTSPVVVLDFQSLYPSMMIAYNLCYSTCLGKLPSLSAYPQPPADSSSSSSSNVPLPTHFTHSLGGLSVSRAPSLLHQLLESSSLWVSASGTVFTRASHRLGILPRLLSEILTTRIMVKQSMKRAELQHSNPHLRMLNARQFALKLISNVTYGYTSAGFSGRMPCAELADSIVQTARRTLEQAIELVEAHPTWRARVVYSDTDSLFVHLEGRTKDQAFVIGREIADAVSRANPKPVRLQLEKVFWPCLLVAKKRYVGYKWDSPSHTKPTLDCKGLEMVRRDGCPAVVKMQEKVLRLLFNTRDLSLIRRYLYTQFSRIYTNRVSLADFILAKEVRLGTYKQLPVAAVVATDCMKHDLRATPLYGQRVPYIIVDARIDARLMEKAVTPVHALQQPHLYRLGAEYYIEKQIIPPIARLLQLLGVDLRAWYYAWPRPRRALYAPPPLPHPSSSSSSFAASSSSPSSSAALLSLLAAHSSASTAASSATSLVVKRTIDHYYASQHCPGCDSLTQRGYCNACRRDFRSLWISTLDALNALTARRHALQRTCHACIGGGYLGGCTSSTSSSSSGSGSSGAKHALEIECESENCAVLYARYRARAKQSEMQQRLTMLQAVESEWRAKQTAKQNKRQARAAAGAGVTTGTAPARLRHTPPDVIDLID